MTPNSHNFVEAALQLCSASSQASLTTLNAFGFRYNQPTTASTAQVLSSYAASVDRQTVPCPQPVYQEVGNVEPPKSSTAVGATDFELLRLAAGYLAADNLDVQNSSMGLAELLRPAGSYSLLLLLVNNAHAFIYLLGCSSLARYISTISCR